MFPIVGSRRPACVILAGFVSNPPLKRKHVMKSIVALMITGVLASATRAGRPTHDHRPGSGHAGPPRAPSGAAPSEAAKKQAHHRKKSKKTTMANAPGDMKKSDTKPATEMAKPATSSGRHEEVELGETD